MSALNIQIEVTNLGMYDLETLKRELTDYARMLVNQTAGGNLSRKGLRPFKELDPHIQALCGVISYPEDDLDGEMLRSEHLKAL